MARVSLTAVFALLACPFALQVAAEPIDEISRMYDIKVLD